ncbi:unnamed protein product [Mucor fragilis]
MSELGVEYFSILNIELPNSRLAQEATAFAKKELDEIMFNHSQRVFLLGRILSQDQFPEWKINYEDYFLTFILHDVGVASRYHLTTSMSFELKVAMASHQFILATDLDIVGAHSDLYHKETINDIV